MNRSDLFFLPLAAATVAMFWVVPSWPFAHLDDPGHWGVLGYVLVLGLVLRLRLKGARGTRTERRLLALFLAGMPVVYVADWFRFGGELLWLGIELVGVLVFWTLAVLGTRSSPWFLVAGLAAHGVWDAAHVGRTAFVADWYTVGCFLVDMAVAVYAAGQVSLWRPARGPR